jgi:hypothetical protein
MLGVLWDKDTAGYQACPGLAPLVETSGLLGKAVLREAAHAACTAVLFRCLDVVSWGQVGTSWCEEGG